ncbi:MAG: fasciclin domain-containing protein, partial [Bacteroidia bacterium]
NPFAALTVFAPTNEAFEAAATALETDIAGLLALPNLADILTYHVLGSELLAEGITETTIVEPLSTTNTLKVTLNAADEVFVNQAQVTQTNVLADNGVIHVLNGVVLPVETVVDIALDNGFTTLAGYVIAADLLPALTNPFASLTVFAPTNEAFAAVPTATIEALEADVNLLTDVLLYHVVGSAALSTDLNDGDELSTLLAGQILDVTITGMDVMINESNVTMPNLEAFNGVVHVIDGVLVPEALSVNDNNAVTGFNLYPNPASDVAFAEFNLTRSEQTSIRISDLSGKVVFVQNANLASGAHRIQLPIADLSSGMYILEINTSKASSVSKLSVN